MKFSLHSLSTKVRSALSWPDRLERALSAQAPFKFDPYCHAGTVDAESVVQWDEWMREPGAASLLGYRRSASGSMHSWFPEVPNLGGSGHAAAFDGWMCDIRDVTALSASKAPLAVYSSLDDLAHAECVGMLEPGCYTADTVARYLDKAGVLPDGSFRRRGDHLEAAVWDGRLSWMNAGGSHNFSAARRIAGAIGLQVPVMGRLKVRALSEASVDFLNNDFAMFVVSGDPVAKTALLEALRIAGASYLSTELPRPYVSDDGQVVFLPRGDERSMRAAARMAEAGCFDLNAHLDELLETQRLVRAALFRQDDACDTCDSEGDTGALRPRG